MRKSIEISSFIFCVDITETYNVQKCNNLRILIVKYIKHINKF